MATIKERLERNIETQEQEVALWHKYAEGDFGAATIATAVDKESAMAKYSAYAFVADIVLYNCRQIVRICQNNPRAIRREVLFLCQRMADMYPMPAENGTDYHVEHAKFLCDRLIENVLQLKVA